MRRARQSAAAGDSGDSAICVRLAVRHGRSQSPIGLFEKVRCVFSCTHAPGGGPIRAVEERKYRHNKVEGRRGPVGVGCGGADDLQESGSVVGTSSKV